MLLVFGTGLTPVLQAQSVTQSLVDRETGALLPATGIAATTPSIADRPPVAPLQVAGVDVRPHADYQFLYGDGIQQVPGSGQKTAIHNFSPGVRLNAAHWNADYTPSWTVYSNSAFRNTVNHSLNFSGFGPFAAGTIEVTDQYEFSDNPRIETGAQTSQNINIARVGANFDIARKFIYELSVIQDARSNDQSPAQRDWSLTNQLHYQFNHDFDGGIGLVVGYVSVGSPGVDAIYVRPVASLRWRFTDKLSVSGQIGDERRRFQRDGAETLSTPTYGASIEYKPGETTSFSLSANRSIQAAYYADQVTQNTGWSAAVRQRLLGRINFTGAVGYQQAKYVVVGGPIRFGRDDDTYSYQANLSTAIFQRGTISVLYQRTRNDSTARGFGFTSSQVGFQLGYRY